MRALQSITLPRTAVIVETAISNEAAEDNEGEYGK
jgi:hypothetical protein